MIVPDPPLLLITDRAAARLPLREVVAAALDGGCRWIMVREKNPPSPSVRPRGSGDARAPGAIPQPWIPAFAGTNGEGRRALAVDIANLGRRYGACVVVNDDVAAAQAADAAGVHLSQGRSVAKARAALGPGALIGVSTHDEAEALAAEAAGADYVTFSPVFASLSKPGYGPGPGEGFEALARIAHRLAIPVVALGGIEPANAARCLAAGARAVAVLGAVMAAPDPRAATERLVEALRTGSLP
jgi:thiamine-phosphate pyrophosphorylase